MTIYESIQRNFRAEDEEVLTNIPFIDDDVNKEFFEELGELYHGGVHEEESVFNEMLGDELFVEVVKALIPSCCDSVDSSLPGRAIFDGIAQVCANNNIEPSKLRARYFRLTGNVDPRQEKVAENIDGDIMSMPQSRELTLKAYKNKFCRRCFMYGCRMHDHIDPPKQLAVMTSLTDTAVACGENCWKHIDGMIQARLDAGSMSTSRNRPNNVWSASDQTVFNMLRHTMTYCEIGQILQTKTCAQVYEFAKENDVANETAQSGALMPTVTRSLQKLTEKQQRQSQQNKRILEHAATIRAKHNDEDVNCYIPCNHEGPCSTERGCPCIKNSNFCEKFCLCSADCKNRFKGCHCTGKCRTKVCICFSLYRECDPDLCKRCGSDKVDISEMSCKNVNTQRKLGKHLYLGISDISGWGVFILSAVKKDEFIAVSLIFV